MRFTVVKVDKVGDGSSIVITARSHDDGQRHKLIVSDFRPYFYVPDDEDTTVKILSWKKQFVSDAAKDLVTGAPVTKVYFNNISDIKPYRTKVPKVWEADIPYTQRFIIDADCRGIIEVPVGEGRVHNILTSEIKHISEDVHLVRKWYLDIEVANKSFCRPEDASAPVCAISIYDNFENTMRTWAWNPNRERVVIEKDFYSRALKTFIPWIETWCENSSDLLLQFADHVNRQPPDLICGWNSVDYDMQYIINHAKTRNIGLESLGGRFVHFTDIPGIQQLDMLAVYKTQKQGELKNATLGEVARIECGIELIKDSDNILHWFENDPDALNTYNALDVDAAYAIDMKCELSEFALRYMNFVGVDVMMDIDSASVVVDVAHLKVAYDMGIALPSRLEEAKHEKYQGATVLTPVPGVHKNVAVLDFSRMYPSIIMGYNMSYETFGGRGIELGPGMTFAKDPPGLSAIVTRNLAALRAKY